MEMEIGRPPDDKIDKGDDKGKKTAARGGDYVSASPGTSSGYSQGFLTDPPGAWVASEQANLSWNWWGPYNCTQLYSYSRSVPAYAWWSGWYNSFWQISPD
jgi:hypothetical protein